MQEGGKGMKQSLLVQACTKFFAGVVLVGVLLFLPAGTMAFPKGWLLMSVLFIPMFLGGLVMWRKSPELLARRLKAKEEQGEQRTVIALSGTMFLAGFLLAGLNFRFHWSELPSAIAAAACVVFLVGYGLFALVLRQNTYLSRTIQVEKGQTVVDTGLYGMVRHPMYTATLLMFLSMPLILGSWQAFLVFLTYPVLIVKRIRNEEAVLTRELQGYEAYCRKIRYRLIPYIW